MAGIKAIDIFKRMIKELPKERDKLFKVKEDEGVDLETITLKEITNLEDLNNIAQRLKLEVEYKSLETNILADNAIQSGTDYSELLEKQFNELKRLLGEKIDELTERERELEEKIQRANTYLEELSESTQEISDEKERLAQRVAAEKQAREEAERLEAAQAAARLEPQQKLGQVAEKIQLAQTAAREKAEEAARQQVESLTLALAEAKAQAAEEGRATASQAEQVEILQEKLAEAKAAQEQVAGLKEELERVQAELANTKGQLNVFKTAIGEGLDPKNVLEISNALSQDTIQKIEEEKIALNSKIDDLQTKLQVAEAETAREKEKVKSQRQKLTENKKEINRLTNELEEEKGKGNPEKITQLTQQLQEAERERDKLEKGEKGFLGKLGDRILRGKTQDEKDKQIERLQQEAQSSERDLINKHDIKIERIKADHDKQIAEQERTAKELEMRGASEKEKEDSRREIDELKAQHRREIAEANRKRSENLGTNK